MADSNGGVKEVGKAGKLDLTKLKGKELLAALESLSPGDLAKVRGAAAAVGLPVATSSASMFAELPDGSVRVGIVVPQDLVPALKEWAAAAGETLEVFLQHYAVEALNAYSMHDWQAAATP